MAKQELDVGEESTALRIKDKIDNNGGGSFVGHRSRSLMMNTHVIIM